MEDNPTVCVLSGSPRPNGSCAHLAQTLYDGLEDNGFRRRILRLSDYRIEGCIGCGACSRTGECVLTDREGARHADGSVAQGFSELYGEIVVADALLLVAPVYFSGPPAQLKCFYDRLQFLWARRYVLGSHPVLPIEQRRPLLLFAVGAGGDPFGYAPLVSCTQSALRMMDFELVEAQGCIGYRTGDPGLDSRIEQDAMRLAEKVFVLSSNRYE